MERICGDCRFFRVSEVRDSGSVGTCRLEKVIGVFRDSMRACTSFARKGEPEPVAPGARRSVADMGEPRPPRLSTRGHEPESPSGPEVATLLSTLDGNAARDLLVRLLGQAESLGVVELGRAWSGGHLLIFPAEDGLKAKELDLDQFFHKLVMIRDNLRVLEQKINSQASLNDAEKLDLQRRLTQCHLALARVAHGWLSPPGAGPLAELERRLSRLLLVAEAGSLVNPLPPMTERFVGGRARYEREADYIEEPLQDFFFRLMVLRDRLMNMEALAGAHTHIGPDESASMSTYIRRCFGSLTSFNLLFKERTDYFTSGG